MAATFHFLLMLLAGTQAFLMVVDEGIFHRRRGLGKFERWGHVADTALFCLTLCVPAFWQPTRMAIISFIVLGFASCLLITKDEWVHAKACEPIEHWCHAMLFILHGALLIVVGMLWILEPQAWELRALPLGVFAWGIYQHFYWNIYNGRRSHQ